MRTLGVGIPVSARDAATSARPLPCPCCGSPTETTPLDFIETIALSTHQRRIAERLAHDFGRFVPTDNLVQAMYAHRSDGGPMTARKIVDIEICYLRKLLLMTPLAIETASSNSGGRRLVWRSVAALSVRNERVASLIRST